MIYLNRRTAYDHDCAPGYRWVRVLEPIRVGDQKQLEPNVFSTVVDVTASHGPDRPKQYRRKLKTSPR